MRSYLIRNCYFTQIEVSAFVALRLGFTCLGLACWPMRGLRRNESWWQHLMPWFALTLWSHSGQCDQRWVVKLTLFGKLIFAYRTKGDADPLRNDTYRQSGLYLFSRKSHRRLLQDIA